MRVVGETLWTGSEDCTLRSWDIRKGKLGHVAKGHTDWVTSVALDCAAGRLATGSSDKTANLWDLATGKVLHTFGFHWRLEAPTGSDDGTFDHAEPIRTVALDCAAGRLATGSGDGTAKLWN